VAREKIDPPERLREQIEARFGQAANSQSGMYLTALWYAVERYDAEHGGPPDQHADEE